ncbi:MAG: hypothetical protein AAGI13_10855 [Pseudomonadota bacterium]
MADNRDPIPAGEGCEDALFSRRDPGLALTVWGHDQSFRHGVFLADQPGGEGDGIAFTILGLANDLFEVFDGVDIAVGEGAKTAILGRDKEENDGPPVFSLFSRSWWPSSIAR